MRYLRGDLSAPVLAILVTIGIIAAGLILLAWFWWFAPQAGKTGTLQVLGTPAINSSGHLHISVRNVGNEHIKITDIYVEGQKCNITVPTSPHVNVTAGESSFIIATCPQTVVSGKRAVNGIIVSDYGTYAFTAAVIG